MTIDEICERVSNFQIKTKNITITGGEPLEQEKELIDLLCELTNYHITLETNGLQSLRTIASYVNCIVMDYKILPEENIMAEKNLRFLGSNDWVKIPIQNIKDFSTALKVRNLLKTEKWSPKLAFSAVAPLTSKQLLSWMFEQKVTDVILNVQIHKLIGVV
jgi:organic radical activating enzyme